MTDNEKLARGASADWICSDPTYQAAWEAIQRDIYKAWVESPREDAAGRERLHLEIDVLARLKAKFLNYMNDAAMVKASQSEAI